MRALAGAESSCDEDNRADDKRENVGGGRIVACSNKFSTSTFFSPSSSLFFIFSEPLNSNLQVLKALVAVGVPTSEEDIKPVEVLISEVRDEIEHAIRNGHGKIADAQRRLGLSSSNLNFSLFLFITFLSKTSTSQATKEIDKAVQKGVLHANTGARRKARMAIAKRNALIKGGLYTPA